MLISCDQSSVIYDDRMTNMFRIYLSWPRVDLRFSQRRSSCSRIWKRRRPNMNQWWLRWKSSLKQPLNNWKWERRRSKTWLWRGPGWEQEFSDSSNVRQSSSLLCLAKCAMRNLKRARITTGAVALTTPSGEVTCGGVVARRLRMHQGASLVNTSTRMQRRMMKVIKMSRICSKRQSVCVVRSWVTKRSSAP